MKRRRREDGMDMHTIRADCGRQSLLMMRRARFLKAANMYGAAESLFLKAPAERILAIIMGLTLWRAYPARP